ncbi:hypothetical protein SAMN04487989_104184 [Bizionia echini]|uniref:Uncharacterized protein n=1 Tax=Bizionia echini TaxID=649333 RepID=A0A1I5C482_9FLAO|nr:hypothetical protein [Bizionia echini]SFN81612.1 hypothetical protein SAMN04487989_104184 [Bizionia echini]
METSTFFNHNTDEEIIQVKRTQELDIWITHLNYVTDESDWLAKIASNKLNDKLLRDALLESSEQNANILNELYNYRTSIVKHNECNDLECDVYYINLHDTYCSRYRKHLETYRKIKSDVYMKILMS